MYCHRLPGIRKIQIVRCSELPSGCMLHSICGCKVVLVVNAEPVDFIGWPKLIWNGAKSDGKRTETSTLEFRTQRPLPEGEQLAFVVTDIHGRQYLIGAREGRYPEITYADTTGTVTEDAAVRAYTVTHTAQKSVLPCVL